MSKQRRALLLALSLAASQASAETIVFVRHGEKPAAGLGQLSCQGLNRALALPPVLFRDFGRPAAIFAPDPSDTKSDSGHDYDYVRPLATIEPTAIAAGMPVSAAIGVTHLDQLQAALEAPALHDAVVFVAWEHHAIETLVNSLLKAHGATIPVPHWPPDDFDSIDIVKLRWTANTATAAFDHKQEGLDGQVTTCPASR